MDVKKRIEELQLEASQRNAKRNQALGFIQQQQEIVQQETQALISISGGIIELTKLMGKTIDKIEKKMEEKSDGEKENRKK
jgi:hypothetical protein